MKRTMTALLILLTLISFAVFAGGAKDEEGYEPVKGMDNWNHEFDLTGMKEGKYNLIIQGKDKAGNIYYEGPLNIFIDPDSDLPVTSISNPRKDSRVGGSLYIVGTCVDDDGVSGVEVKIDDGEFRPAEGTEFWSFSLDVEGIGDGRHTITARGTDINGLPGEETSTTFNLDTTKPLNRVTSHENGVLVSGKLKLDGTVVDANGVESLGYSSDGGKTYEPLKLSQQKGEGLFRFSFGVDTTKLQDGPYVYWFRSVDKTRSVGYAAFLFFVDNTEPVLDIYTPLPDEGVNGIITLAGKVTDKIGVKSLSFDAGEGMTGTIELKPGNPYWSQTFDFSAEQKKVRQVTFSMEDAIGNTTVYKYTVKMDFEADLPVINVISPAPDSQIAGDVKLAGYASDDDGLNGIMYALDGGETLTVQTAESFNLVLPDVRPGKHKLTVRSVDINGTQGREQVILFTKTDPPAVITMDTLDAGGAASGYRPGIEVDPLQKNTLKGSIVSTNGILSSEFVLGGGEPQKLVLRKGEGEAGSLFDILIPPEVVYGIVPLRITVKDTYGQETVYDSFIHVTNLARVRQEPGVVFSDARLQADGTIRLSADEPLSGVFVGEPVRSVRFTTDPGTATVTNQGERIIVRPSGSGVGKPARIEVTTQKGHVFLSRELKIITDLKAPAVTLAAPVTGLWVRNNFTFEGTATDETGISKLEYSLDGGATYTAITVPASEEKTVKFSGTASVSSREEGAVAFDVRAADLAGNTAVTRSVVMKDTEEPLLSVVMPEKDVPLNGKLQLYGRTVDEGHVAKVELSFDGSTYAPVTGTSNFFYEGAVPSPGEPGRRVFLRVTDRSGNMSVFRPEINLSGRAPAPEVSADPAKVDKEKPVITVLSHAQNDRVHGKFAIAGKVTDASGVKSLSFSLNGVTEELPLVPGNPYWMKVIDLTGTDIKKISITFGAEDSLGNKGTLAFALTPDETTDMPVVTLKYPEARAVLELPAAAFGSIADDEGTRSVSWSVDAGESKVQPSSEGFVIDLSSVPPGAHVLKVAGIDSNGLQGKIVEVPFTLVGPAPVVKAASVFSDRQTLDFYPGMTIACDALPELQGTIRSGSALKNVEYALEYGEGAAGERKKAVLKKGAEETETGFGILLPKELPYTQVRLAVYVEDIYGKKSEYRTFFYNVRPIAGEVRDEEALVFMDARVGSDGRVLLAGGESLNGLYNGRKLKSARFDPPTSLLNPVVEGNFITIKAVQSGLSEPLTLKVVTIDDDEYTWGPKIYRTDLVAPQLTLTAPKTGDWYGSEFTLSGTALERETKLSAVSFSLNGGEFRPLETDPEKLAADGSLSMKVPLSAVEDGGVHLVVKAEDAAGNVSFSSVSFMKDTAAPVIELITPPSADRINGYTTLVGRVKDKGQVIGVEYSDDGETFVPVNGTGFFIHDVDFSRFTEIPEKLAFRATDRGGNTTLFLPPLNLDLESDVPVVQIQTPEEGEVIRNDFIISGMVFDDDGVQSISYSLDGGEFIELPGGSSFSIKKELSSITDNEHTIEVMAVDFGGVESLVAKSTFKVSLAEPVAQMTAPRLDQTVKGDVTVTGTASDRNGIREIFASFDNGNTFFRAEGTESWNYTFDTRLLRDGVYSVMIKAVDGYGTEGLYATLLSIDNTRPSLVLDYPQDGVHTASTILVEGRVSDNIQLSSLTMKAYPLQDRHVEIMSVDLPLTEVYSEVVDIGALAPGWYNLRIEAIDQADNHTYIARNVLVERRIKADKLEILYPGDGSILSGSFSIEGRVTTETPVTFIPLVRDDGTPESVPVDENGYFRYEVSPETLESGEHTFRLKMTKQDDSILESNLLQVSYRKEGPWARIDSHRAGTYITGRPFLTGSAGYYLPAADKADKAAWADYTAQLKTHRIVRVEVSVDNGKTFEDAKGLEEWQFRLETQYYKVGHLMVLVKVSFADGASAVTSTHLFIDSTPPKIVLFNLQENGRYNQKLPITGTARDDNEVSLVAANLRLGDKSSYEIPEFIQGLYLDVHYLGVTYIDIGAGLTFFDDNVKLQVQGGQAPSSNARFPGMVLGAKLLANIAKFPAKYFFGPDWEWLSLSLAVGANFSYFTMSVDPFDFSRKGLVLGSVIGQIEFPIVKLARLRMFNTYSFFTEFQYWFISSDVEGGIKPKLSFGTRANIF